MSILAGISAGVGAIGTIAGAIGSRSAARRQQRELEKQAARNEAWYARNYYSDYLNSSEAQNAIRRLGNTLRERSQASKARQAITGATPEQSIAESAEYNKSMADMIGNLAAAGESYRRDVDAKKLQMDASLSAQRQGIAQAQQGANANLMSAGLRSMMNGLSQYDFGKLKF